MASDPDTGEEPQPPPLPPPLPATDGGADTSGDGAPGSGAVPDLAVRRLHPATLIIAVWNVLRGLLLPFVILFVASRQREGSGLLFFIAVLAALGLVQAVVRYLTFSYRIEEGDLVTAQGLLNRRQRHIPLHRVQDIRIEQGIFHRLLGVVDAHVETAGGQGPEASLSVLARPEAERLRSAVFASGNRGRTGAQGLAEGGGEGGGEGVTAAAQDEEEVIRQLTPKELVLAGITSNQTASTLALVAAGMALLDDFLGPEQYERVVRGTMESASSWVESWGGDWLVPVAAFLGILVVGLTISVIGSLVLFHGFRLSRRGEDLCREYGLFTRRSSSLPRRRVQLVKIEETVLRRLFGLATLSADTAAAPQAGDGDRREGRNVLLPVLPAARVEEVLQTVYPGLRLIRDGWLRVSPIAIRRGSVKAVSACLLCGAALWFSLKSPWTAGVLGLIPFLIWVQFKNYRHLGYRPGSRFFLTRRGWLRRFTHVVPTRNVQAVILRQTPLDRWHGVCTLHVDTAGQAYTGGGPAIPNVPLEEARETARRLAHQAARFKFRS